MRFASASAAARSAASASRARRSVAAAARAAAASARARAVVAADSSASRAGRRAWSWAGEAVAQALDVGLIGARDLQLVCQGDEAVQVQELNQALLALPQTHPFQLLELLLLHEARVQERLAVQPELGLDPFADRRALHRLRRPVRLGEDELVAVPRGGGADPPRDRHRPAPRELELQLQPCLLLAVLDAVVQLLAVQWLAEQRDEHGLEERALAGLVVPLDQDPAAGGEREVDVGELAEFAGDEAAEADHGGPWRGSGGRRCVGRDDSEVGGGVRRVARPTQGA